MTEKQTGWVRCDLCRADDCEPYLRIAPLGRDIVRCRRCGLLYVNPVSDGYLTLDFEEEKARTGRYEQMLARAQRELGLGCQAVYEQETAFRRKHFESRLAMISEHCRGGALLDVGCARGLFLSVVPQDRFTIYGVEPRPETRCQAAARLGEDKVFAGTLKEAALEPSSFDVVTLINVIEHVPSPREMLEEVGRVLKPGGLVLIETPDVEVVLARLLKARWHAFREMEHHFFFGAATLGRLLAATGFEVIARRQAHKLFSWRYFAYQLNWYSHGLAGVLGRLVEALGIEERTIRLPQPGEMIVLARKGA